jgi:hypothetical protein
VLDCTTDTYETLYARWLEKPGTLLDWGHYDPQQHHRLLDVCGGTGAIAHVARAKGGNVTLLDLNPRCTDPSVETLKGRVEDLRELSQGRLWDFLVCRQALCYLDLSETARALFDVSVAGTPFVCNAFTKPKWSLQRYRFRDHGYLEASGYIGKQVFHLQAMRGDLDVTTFRWYSVDEIRNAFSPYWTQEKFEQTGTSLRFCFLRRSTSRS